MAEVKSLYGSKPEDVFKEEYWGQYRWEREVLWGEVVQLNTYTYLVKKIAHFPFNLFSLNQNAFWNYTLESMIDSCTTIIFKILYDRNREVLTLPALKERIRKNLLFPEHRKELDERLKDADHNDKFDEYQKIVTDQRHQRVAHFNEKHNKAPDVSCFEQRRRIFQSLEPLCKSVNALFDSLCLHTYHGKTVFEYQEGLVFPPNDESRSDIEILLDWVAENSPLLRMKEDQPDYWPHYRETLSDKDIEELNRYRKKFGLPAVC